MWNSPDLLHIVFTIFHSHWPFSTKFTWDDLGEKPTLWVQRLVDGTLLMAWTWTAVVQSNVEKAETKMRSLAFSIVEDDQERFMQLVSFRLDLGRRYDDLKRSRSFVVRNLTWQPPVKPVFHGQLRRLRTDEDPHMEKPLLDRQAELEKRLDAIKEDLNEEIQVAVGTVQVHDAQLMKEQATVTARRTAWTVALTVLAAVYLPMTLVTGIFGMNITEVSSEKTAPNAWWAVGA
jgi:Mg2+ and Co2+ transporter CorA